MRNFKITVFWIFVLLASLYFFFKSTSDYFTGNLDLRRQGEKWWLISHFVGASCTLFLGPLQFWKYFRNRYKKWHRLAGKFYIGGSVLSALMVFYLLTNYPLPGSIPSLMFLALIWLFTTIVAYWFAIKKNFNLHKEYMIRSYVCGLAFLFIRLLPLVDNYTGFFGFMKNEEVRLTVYEWICWAYPLIITEFFLVWYPSIKKQRSLGK